jgi:hypothetical protein
LLASAFGFEFFGGGGTSVIWFTCHVLFSRVFLFYACSVSWCYLVHAHVLFL